MLTRMPLMNEPDTRVPKVATASAGDGGCVREMEDTHTPLHFQSIAHQGACGKTRVVPHNRWLGQRTYGNGIGADGVSPLTASAFNLPDRLAPKADPVLIADDEQHFAAIAESLERSIADLSSRLDAERKAPGGIGQAALDRAIAHMDATGRPYALVMQKGSVAPYELKDSGRVVIRYSGTEALARVMIEAESEQQMRVHADRIAQAIRVEIGL